MSRPARRHRSGPVGAAAGATGLLGVLLLGQGAVAATSPEVAPLVARPPAVASGDGVIASVDAAAVTVDGVIAEVVPRTSSEDGALEQEGTSDFTLAGDVYFAFDSADLAPRAAGDLAAVAAQLSEAGVEDVLVVGHTDSMGSDSYNQELSEARAAAVVTALEPRLPGVTLTAEGRGESEPVAEERTETGADDPEGRALNRRVTISPAG
ncbi:OmpA family protein [Aquipuribacter sp. SD81]|uniref:OmpA family protein n=1 Tax=Aquipuribacter sp. SD81 TaxID=3127703 RepID=UPI00301873E6